MKFISINLKPVKNKSNRDLLLENLNNPSLLNASAYSKVRKDLEGNFLLDLTFHLKSNALNGKILIDWKKEYNFEIVKEDKSIENDKIDLEKHIKYYLIFALNAYSGNNIAFQNEVYPSVNLSLIFDKTYNALVRLGFWYE